GPFVKLIATGISGFDELFYGGILPGSTVLVEGIPGAGKTTLGLEFLYRGAHDLGEPGVLLTFEQFPASIYRDAMNFGWDLRSLERENRLRVICTSPEAVLTPETGFLEEAVREIGAKRLLVDSISHFRQVIEDPLQLRREFYSFCNGLRRLGLTSFLVQEQEHESEGIHGFEEFVVDAVVRLGYDANGGLQRRRSIEVLKSRGQPHISGKHSFSITPEGVRVYSLRPHLPEPAPVFGGLLRTGIKGLDELLGGGIPRGSSVVVIGEAGTGKTVLGLEYLVKGALLFRERGLYVSLEEAPERIVSQAAAFGWDLAELERQGLIQVYYRPLVDLEIDEFIFSLGALVRENRFQRAVIDSLPDLIGRISDAVLLREKAFYMIGFLNNAGCTTLLLYPSGKEFGGEHLEVVQALAQGSILLSSALVHSRRIRRLELYKMRGVGHLTGSHLMEITSSGVQVYPRVGGF
ncbi:MAG: ATPase domain-containing protein, partial [Thermacetogeniaceae bacterium]